MFSDEILQDTLNHVSKLTGRSDFTLNIFRENINLWLMNLIVLLQYDDCLFIPLITAILKRSCARYIVNNYIKNAQKYICLYIVNPAIVALQRILNDKLLLYRTLVDIENIIRCYNIRHELLCEMLSMLTQLLIDIEYSKVINNSHGKAPAHVLRLCINSLTPFVIRLTNNTKCYYWTGLFNSLLRIKLDFSVSNVILNLEIAATVEDQTSHIPLLLAETFKVSSMISMLHYSTLDPYIKRVCELKEKLITKYCIENLIPVMLFYKSTLIDLANHKYHNTELPSITNNLKLNVFTELNKTAYTVIMPHYIKLLVKSYMALMLKLPKTSYLCKKCSDYYIQQHLHFIYEMMDYTHTITKKIGEWMGKDPINEFEKIFETIKSIIICLVGSEHILSMNWFSHSKKLPSEISNMLHCIAIRYSPCKSMISILRKTQPVTKPLSYDDCIRVRSKTTNDIPVNETVSLLMDNEWIDAKVMHESHLLLFHYNTLLISIVDLRHITGVIKYITPHDPLVEEIGKGYIIKLVTDEWRFGGIEKLDGLSHQPFVTISLSTEGLRDVFFTALKALLDKTMDVGDGWIFPKYRHFDLETELKSYFEDTTQVSSDEYG